MANLVFENGHKIGTGQAEMAEIETFLKGLKILFHLSFKKCKILPSLLARCRFLDKKQKQDLPSLLAGCRF
jgi:hypothetical protein